jgi:microcystin-dependent protein
MRAMATPFVGEIRLFGGNFAPVGWALCNGGSLPIAANELLFSVIGATYGGDGQTTFALPNLQSRIPVHQGPGYTLGKMAGSETVTLSPEQLPAHTHTLLASTTTGNSADPTGRVWGQATGASAAHIFSTSASNTTLHPSSLMSVGGGQPHDNMTPFLVINFIIALVGIFPSQS